MVSAQKHLRRKVFYTFELEFVFLILFTRKIVKNFIKEDELNDSASQIYSKWSEETNAVIKMQIIQHKASMNGSIGVRICKVQNGEKVYFDQFLARFKFCQIAIDNNSDTSVSSDDDG